MASLLWTFDTTFLTRRTQLALLEAFQERNGTEWNGFTWEDYCARITILLVVLHRDCKAAFLNTFHDLMTPEY
jgi:hypothetical protein